MTQTTTAIAPGAKVRQKLSGIEGTVRTRTEYLSGYIYLSVQPPAKKGATEEPKILYADECEWEPLGEHVERPATPDTKPPHFDLGARVKDVVTGFQGIVNARTDHFNHCWSYDVQSEIVKKEDGASGALESFQSVRLRLIDEGLNRVVKPRHTGPSAHVPRKGL